MLTYEQTQYFDRILAIFEGAEKMVVSPDCFFSPSPWGSDYVHAGFCACAVYIYFVLIPFLKSFQLR